MNHLRANTSVPNSALTQVALRVVELLGAHRPDLELIIWASVRATDEEVNELASLISPQDAELLERVVKRVFWSYGLNLCDRVGGLPA